MNINNFEFIYFPIMDEIHPCKFNIHLWTHHPCRWIKITLNFEFQAQSSKFRLHIHAQANFMNHDVDKEDHIILSSCHVIIMGD